MIILNSPFRLILLLALIFSCSSKTEPYDNGPVMTQKNIKKTFQPILDFMEVKPGMTFADFGAGSGANSVMMASLMENSSIYIQDIDSAVLNKSNLDRIIDYYSKQGKRNLRETNNFRLVIGETTRTKLPHAAFDIIYTNATMHVVDSPDLILQDLKQKLKADGKLFIRDSFKNDHKEGNYCSDKNCGKPLMTINEFLVMMKRNNFRLVKQSPDMSGYPVFRFIAN